MQMDCLQDLLYLKKLEKGLDKRTAEMNSRLALYNNERMKEIDNEKFELEMSDEKLCSYFRQQEQKYVMQLKSNDLVNESIIWLSYANQWVKEGNKILTVESLYLNKQEMI
jgi:hypothetical protein